MVKASASAVGGPGCAVCLCHTCDFKQVHESIQGVLCVLVTPVILNRCRRQYRVCCVS